MADLIELDQEEHGAQQCEGVCGLFKYKVTSEQVGNVKVTDRRDQTTSADSSSRVTLLEVAVVVVVAYHLQATVGSAITVLSFALTLFIHRILFLFT
ncbi:hypothetical protein EVAR_96387_1 [Eumeta japonica]|uniref:Uncharacterized protein n=1 Tax=Eumeta variegata TaxID=151549 RepID=A0A4C1WCZ4_EUMVA|nr:hypothetical protein EVAR_96387_1 [Eumeta japonica]